MNISNKLLTLIENWNSGYCNYSDIDNNDLAILAIFHLHQQKKINDERLNAYCKQYNNNTICRKVKTYHCKINDKWYNDSSTFTAIMDSYNELCIKQDLNLETMLTYLNRLLNKPRNYCIDHLYFSYVRPIITRLESTYGIELFNSLNVKTTFKTYEEMDNNGNLSSGYCCKDCDGCLGEYKRNRYNSYLGYNYIEKLEKEIKSYLNNNKTISAFKNFNNKLM